MKVILKNFPFASQTTGYTCGPVCILMCCKYFNKEAHLTELEIAKEVKTEYVHRKGTSLQNMVKFFKKHKFKYISSTDRDICKKRNKLGQIFTEEEFKSFVINNIKQGYPIIIRNSELGEHYRVIIGYEEKEKFIEDRIFFADPYDKYDDTEDGETAALAEKFYWEWVGNYYVPKKWREQPFIIVMG